MEKLPSNSPSLEHLNRYLSPDLSLDNPAIDIKTDQETKITQVVTDRLLTQSEIEADSSLVDDLGQLTPLNQAKLLTNMINLLRGGEIPAELNHFNEADQKIIHTAVKIVNIMRQNIQNDHPQTETVTHKVADELEQHRDYVLKQDPDSQPKRGFSDYGGEIYTPESTAERVFSTAKKYLEDLPNDADKQKIKSLKPGEVVKLSRHYYRGTEPLPRSAYIYMNNTGQLQLAEQMHMKTPTLKKPTLESTRTKIGEGSFNIAKKAIDQTGKFIVSRKPREPIPLNQVEVAQVDVMNEQHFNERISITNPKNILLPLASGRQKSSESERPSGAIKETNTTLYPYATGGDLSNYIPTYDPNTQAIKNPKKEVDLKQTKTFISEILGGVGEIHELGMAHRDLKPQNILLVADSTIHSNSSMDHRDIKQKADDKMHAKISDFGTIQDPKDEEHNSRLPERMNAQKLNVLRPLGTYPYIPPEALGGSYAKSINADLEAHPNDIGKRILYNQNADIWSLGLILFQMMNSEGPSLLQKECEQSNNEVRMRGVISQFDPSKTQYAEDFAKFEANCKGRFNDDQIDIVKQCFALNPKDRPTIKELRDAFS